MQNQSANEVHVREGEHAVDTALDELLQGEPRAAVWKELRLALTDRLTDAVAHRHLLPPDDPEREAWDLRIVELRNQIAALASEEAITEFVEDSVRATLARPRPSGAGRFDGDEGDEGDDWDEAVAAR